MARKEMQYTEISAKTWRELITELHNQGHNVDHFHVGVQRRVFADNADGFLEWQYVDDVIHVNIEGAEAGIMGAGALDMDVAIMDSLADFLQPHSRIVSIVADEWHEQQPVPRT